MNAIPSPAANGQQHNTNALLAAAKAYAARGWSIIPTVGKEPPERMPWKTYQTTRPDEPTLCRLFSRQGITGLAVLLGSVSGGLVCRDFDRMESYDQWAAAHPQLAAALPTVATARGRHVYFRGPEGFHDFGDGEYRGDHKHYVVLPPSRHPAGAIYSWLVPLPDGELPLVDPFQAGLCNREDRAGAEDGANTEDREDGVNGAEPQPPPTALSSLSAAPALLQAIENAIAVTLPTMQSQRNACVFRLARHLKGIPSLQSAAVGRLRPIAEHWHRRALPVIGTQPFLDTWADFVQAWKRVRIPANQGAIETAFQRAVASAPPPTFAKLYGEGPIVFLATFCRELQHIVGDGEFYLDCRTAGRLIGVDHTTAWRYLDVLCADGVLAAGSKGSKATRKASRFRFINLEQEGETT